MADRPDVLIVFRQHISPAEAIEIQGQLRDRFPDWSALIFDGDVVFYQADTTGSYALAEPTAVLDGPAVAEYLDRKNADAARPNETP